MPSSHVPSMNDRWLYANIRSRTDFQLRFKKKTDTYIISKLIVKERVALTSLYIQLVMLLAYF